jgi:hypothetical protein
MTRDRVPLQWAQTQNNLGRILLDLGRRLESAEHLRAALDAFEKSREVFATTESPHADYFTSIVAETRAELDRLE